MFAVWTWMAGMATDHPTRAGLLPTSTLRRSWARPWGAPVPLTWKRQRRRLNPGAFGPFSFLASRSWANPVPSTAVCLLCLTLRLCLLHPTRPPSEVTVWLGRVLTNLCCRRSCFSCLSSQWGKAVHSTALATEMDSIWANWMLTEVCWGFSLKHPHS